MNENKPFTAQTNHLDSLVLLRGLAVIMVCFCHYGNPLSAGDHFFTKLFLFFKQYGKFGVEIFFVISGFIIPYSLYKGKYQLGDYFTFLYKRLLRLHPPYLLALFITLVIMYFSYKTRHVAFPEDFASITRSLVYLHFPPDNPVFWTLAVEAQYYLFVGLFYVLLVNYSLLAYFLVVPVFLFLGHTSLVENFSLLKYFVFFFIGNAAFMIYLGIGNKWINSFSLASLVGFSYFFYELPAFLCSTFTLSFILLYRKQVFSSLKFIGTISYSIYLIHFPIGIKFINLLKPRINPSYSWLLFVVTVVFVVLVSLVFYKIIEAFSEDISKKIKYREYKQRLL